jgi:hypothetical protein
MIIDLNHQIGFFVGMEFVRTQIPMLTIFSTHKETAILPKTAKIQVDEDDTIELKKYNENRWNGNDIDIVHHIKYVEFTRYLEKKYLPHYIECDIEVILYSNEEHFLKGVVYALWYMSSSYVLDFEKPIIKDEDSDIMIIHFKLHCL